MPIICLIISLWQIQLVQNRGWEEMANTGTDYGARILGLTSTVSTSISWHFRYVRVNFSATTMTLLHLLMMTVIYHSY